jgi:hypothetical protein
MGGFIQKQSLTGRPEIKTCMICDNEGRTRNERKAGRQAYSMTKKSRMPNQHTGIKRKAGCCDTFWKRCMLESKLD